MFNAYRNKVQLQVDYSPEKGLSITGTAAHSSQQRTITAITQSELLLVNGYLNTIDGLVTEWEVRDYFIDRGWTVEPVV